MNKKIISIFFLLIILVSVVASYNYFSQSSTEEKQIDDSKDKIDDEAIGSEIDDSLIDEDYEVEIGEMI